MMLTPPEAGAHSEPKPWPGGNRWLVAQHGTGRAVHKGLVLSSFQKVTDGKNM